MRFLPVACRMIKEISMTTSFSNYDIRNYPTLGVADGYGEWAPIYEDTVLDLMDLDLLARIETVNWRDCQHAADFACGTGRIGAWLKGQGARVIDGVDLTPQMLEIAKEKGAYHSLRLGDVGATGLEAGAYDAVTMSLADEHLSNLAPLYKEASRLLKPGGKFVNVGYHPYFQMQGVPTHFDRTSGESVQIEANVHFTSDQVAAGLGADLTLLEMHERLIDDGWIAAKPKWEKYRNLPVTFALVWGK